MISAIHTKTSFPCFFYFLTGMLSTRLKGFGFEPRPVAILEQDAPTQWLNSKLFIIPKETHKKCNTEDVVFYLHDWTWRTKHNVLTRASQERAIACFWCRNKDYTETQDEAWVSYMASSKDVVQPQWNKHFLTSRFKCMRLHVLFYKKPRCNNVHATCHLGGWHTPPMGDLYWAPTNTQGHRGVVLKDGLLYGLQIMIRWCSMLPGRRSPPECMCGEVWSNLGTLITQCNRSAASHRARVQ